MRRFFRTVKFVITDTFKSRKGSVPVDRSLARTLRDASAVGRTTGGAAGSETAGKIASEGSAAYNNSLEKDV